MVETIPIGQWKFQYVDILPMGYSIGSGYMKMGMFFCQVRNFLGHVWKMPCKILCIVQGGELGTLDGEQKEQKILM